MNIYQIDAELLSLVDEETGEITDPERLEALLSARDDKIESAATLYKQFKADAKAIDDEIKALRLRNDTAENNAERLSKYIKAALNGATFKSGRCSVSYRKSRAVEITDEAAFIAWARKDHREFLTYKDPAISKTSIKDALEAGTEVPYAGIVENTNISIK